MKVGAYMAAMRGVEQPKGQRDSGRRFSLEQPVEAEESNRAYVTQNSRLGELGGIREEEKEDGEEAPKDRSEALKIVKAAMSGGKNPIEELRKPPKVPYEHLAKDGVIIYNDVCFVCDKRTNSICLGDMTDEKKVLTIPLSGGGNLKVNRANIGDLSKAIGMFSPEDVNLIMRAIALDAKLQATEKEIDDMEASVGNQISGDTKEGQEAESA